MITNKQFIQIVEDQLKANGMDFNELEVPGEPERCFGIFGWGTHGYQVRFDAGLKKKTMSVSFKYFAKYGTRNNLIESVNKHIGNAQLTADGKNYNLSIKEGSREITSYITSVAWNNDLNQLAKHTANLMTVVHRSFSPVVAEMMLLRP